MGPWYSCRYGGSWGLAELTWLEEGPEGQACSVFEALLVNLCPRALLVTGLDPVEKLRDASQRFS